MTGEKAIIGHHPRIGSVVSWRETKFKFVSRIISGGTPQSDNPDYWDGPITWLTPVDLGNRGSDAICDSARRLTTAGVKAAGLEILPSGSVVISTRAPIGSVGLLACEATTNQGCKAVVPEERLIDSKFTYYLALDSAEKLQSLGLGTTFIELSTYALKNFRLCLPNVIEQRRIAAYLDKQTAKIDRLIDLRQRQIELLREQRAALIQQAVTRGLNPNVPMKDSGIPWLGEIPAHWEAKRLKWFATLQRGYDLPDYERIEGDFPVVTSGGIVSTHNRPAVEGPGVVTGRYGSTGNVFYVESDYWPHNTVLFVKDFHRNEPQFVFFVMKTLNYGAHSSKSAVPGIDRKDLHEIMVAVPTPWEQKEIVEFIHTEASKVEALVASLERQITLLQEYRASLIHECVTGQRSVAS